LRGRDQANLLRREQSAHQRAQHLLRPRDILAAGRLREEPEQGALAGAGGSPPSACLLVLPALCWSGIMAGSALSSPFT